VRRAHALWVREVQPADTVHFQFPWRRIALRM
jgi:hypothetical protein